jgi:sigma-B regulation protein RsbU (phosphoserine phosphatase)
VEAARDEAHLIQDSLLPRGTLRRDGFEVAFRFAPLGEVGGDFADFFPLPNGLVGLYLGDVVGKGLIAVMYASLMMGTIRGINKTDEDTGAVLSLLNKRLRVRPVPGRYSSMIYALFNPVSGVLAFSNAGIPLPLPVSTDSCRALGEGGFPSGMFPDASYQIHSVQLAPGDAVLFATDGLHEMRNAQNDDTNNSMSIEPRCSSEHYVASAILICNSETTPSRIENARTGFSGSGCGETMK